MKRTFPFYRNPRLSEVRASQLFQYRLVLKSETSWNILKAHGEKQWVEFGWETGIYILKYGPSDFQSNTKSENGTLLVHTKRPSETRLIDFKSKTENKER